MTRTKRADASSLQGHLWRRRTCFPVTVGMLLLAASSTIATAGERESCAGVAATIVGTDSRDRIVGTPKRDVIAGLGGDDVIQGGAGADLICGGDGADRLSGNGGDDVVRGGWGHLYLDGVAHDHLWGGLGDDRLIGGKDPREDSASDFLFRDTIHFGNAPRAVVFDERAGTVTGQGRDRISQQPWQVIGSPFDDTLIAAGLRGDVLFGLEGDDLMKGSRGPDELGDSATKRSTGSDTIIGGAGDDRLSSTGGNDIQRGGDGDDRLYVNSRAASRMYGGDGHDYSEFVVRAKRGQVVDGGRGHDRTLLIMSTGVGEVSNVKAVLDMARGTAHVLIDPAMALTVADVAHVSLAGGHWTVYGTPGSDVVDARGARSLSVFGRASPDVLLGSGGDDRLDGGAGKDRALARSGWDVCAGVEVELGRGCERSV